jgi:sugar lactone lactonase YvrE
VRPRTAIAGLILAGALRLAAQGTHDLAWPPELKGAVHGTVTVTDERFLKVPPQVEAVSGKEGAAPFVVASTPPTVDLAFHGSLPGRPSSGTGWSAWGDIAVAQDGRVWCGIGDHGKDSLGQSHVLLYAWDPTARTLRKALDLNAVVPRTVGEPTWSKIHARIDEGTDGRIYVTGTLNSGERAGQTNYLWSAAVPGGQLYAYDPATGKATVVANLPTKRVTATSLLDRERNTWWCNLEGGSNALWAVDLATGREKYRAPEGSMAFNRNFALARDGAVYFNGPEGLWRCDAGKRETSRTGSAFPAESAQGMRASTRESRDGWIYGVTMRPGRLFRYSPARDSLEMLGPEFLGGDYTTVCVLSPDERFVYYLPGAHGDACKLGTPVVQYDLARRQRKVLAFLREPFESDYGYVPAGTYGAKLSADGSTLYVNFNGHAADGVRPKGMRGKGFGLTAFAAIHIPASER